jgi:hypothetical protein
MWPVGILEAHALAGFEHLAGGMRSVDAVGLQIAVELFERSLSAP